MFGGKIAVILSIFSVEKSSQLLRSQCDKDVQLGFNFVKINAHDFFNGAPHSENLS